MLTKFGAAVRAARKDVGTTMLAMADFIGVKPSFLSQVETGKKKIPDGFVAKAEEFFLTLGKKVDLAESAVMSSKTINLEDVDPRMKYLIAGFARGNFSDEQIQQLTEIMHAGQEEKKAQ